MSQITPIVPVLPSRFSYLSVPGIGDSGPDHWQTWMEDVGGGVPRIRLANWKQPSLNAWLNAIDTALTSQWSPAILVAHSFGALAAAQYAIEEPSRIAGLLLVAPADPAKFEDARHLTLAPVPCAGFLVASRNDPWMEMRVAQRWSDIWRVKLIDEGDAGHINVASGHGPWPQGLSYLARLTYEAGARTQARVGSIYLGDHRRNGSA